MFDLTALDTLTASEEGRWFHPIHPGTGRHFTDAAGAKFGIMLYGRHSSVARDALRRMQDVRAAREAAGATVDEAEGERLLSEYLARCTKAWTPLMLDGVELPCTFENATKVWMDQRFRWLRVPVQNFIMDDGGFFPG